MSSPEAIDNTSQHIHDSSLVLDFEHICQDRLQDRENNRVLLQKLVGGLNDVFLIGRRLPQTLFEPLRSRGEFEPLLFRAIGEVGCESCLASVCVGRR